MTTDDRTRLDLHRRLTEVLGIEEADTLMSHLPPVTWNEVATRSDVSSSSQMLGSELRGEMALLGGQLRTEMAELGGQLRSEMAELGGQLRSEMAELGGQLRTEMAELRGEVHTDMADLRHELRSEMGGLRADMERGFNRQIRWIVTIGMAWSSLLVLAVRVGT